MREQASCPTKDPMQLALQGQGLTVDPSCRSRRGLSRKQVRNRNHTISGGIGSTPYDQPGLTVDDRKHYIGTLETTPSRRPPMISPLAHRSWSQAQENRRK